MSETSTSQAAAAKPSKRENGQVSKKRWERESYADYVEIILKQVHPDMDIDDEAKSAMDTIIEDVFERIAQEAARQTKLRKRKTLTEKDVEAAVREIFKGELAVGAVIETGYIMKKYNANSKPTST